MENWEEIGEIMSQEYPDDFDEQETENIEGMTEKHGENITGKPVDLGANNSDSDDDVLSKTKEKIFKESLQKPIAIRKKKRTVKKRRYYDDDSSITDHADPTFKMKDDNISSESEPELCKKRKKCRKIKRKKPANEKTASDKQNSKNRKITKTFKAAADMAKKQNISRNIGWKKKPTTLSKKKKQTPGRPLRLRTGQTMKKDTKKKLFRSPTKTVLKSPSSKSIMEAKQRSQASFRARQLIYNIHSRNLDSLLFSNGLKRYEIEGDGNCFFAAINKSLTGQENPTELRAIICDHLQSHREEYIPFLAYSGEITEKDRECMYEEQVQYLREDGRWSSSLGDAVPLAASNTLKREILILSSRRNRPIFKIEPTLCQNMNEQHISLAHIAVPGIEHFDACVNLDEDTMPDLNRNKTDKDNVTEITKQKTPTKTLENRPKTSETTTKTPETPTKTPETSTKTPTKTTETSTKTPTKTPKTPTKTPETLTQTPETATKTPETATKTPKTPTKTQKTPTKTQKTPTKTQKTPTNAQKTPTNAQKTPTNAQETPTKSQKKSANIDLNNPKVVTPRKQADYRSPKRKIRSRKIYSKPGAWKKNIRKELRLSGKQYISTTGKTMREKAVQPQDCSKCRFKCSVNIPDEARNELFTNFWNLKDYARQRDFFCSTVIEKPPDRIKLSATRSRQLSRVYNFNSNGEQIRVCKQFYTKTLDVGEKTIEFALKSNKSGIFVSKDKRGHHTPHNKTPEQSLFQIRQHIESFPVMDPHYTRKDTHRKFLGSDLNICKMYRLYKAECTKTNTKPVGPTKYRRVFCTEYNYSFHTPKKDQCRLCSLHLEKQAKDELTEADKEKYNQHMKRKILARSEKNTG